MSTVSVHDILYFYEETPYILPDRGVVRLPVKVKCRQKKVQKEKWCEG